MDAAGVPTTHFLKGFDLNRNRNVAHVKQIVDRVRSSFGHVRVTKTMRLTELFEKRFR
jgi:hypothetical protein